MNARQQRSAARRMIHRSRSVAVVVTLAVVAVTALWVAVAVVLDALGARSPWPSPGDVVAVIAGTPWIAALAAVALALVGLILVVVALAPGRRGRRVLADDRALIVVDDTVLAGALSRSAASAARVPAGQVSTALGRRSALVSVAPLSGYPVAADAVSEAVDRTLQAARPARATSTRVRVAPRGRILS